MTEDQFTDAAIERIREVAEDYRRLARSIEDAVRPDGSGRSIDRLRRILETSEGTLADTMRPIQNDAVAGVASCYLRLIARIAQRTCEAADEGDTVTLAATSFLMTSLSRRMLSAVREAEIALDHVPSSG